MSSVRVHNFAVSLDGYATGEGQSMDQPFGHAGDRLMRWYTATRTFRSMHSPGPDGPDGAGSTGVDDAMAAAWSRGVGAEIMGRNKFGPQRGPWSDEEWQGWWGDAPPFHTPVFVLTHHPRPSVEMAGGTTFHFLDATPAEALRAARAAAGDLDVRIGGGPTTVREFLAADLIDTMHIAMVPIVLGGGVRLWDGPGERSDEGLSLSGLENRFDIESVTGASGVTHLMFTRVPRVVSASREIGADAATVFELIADPAQQPRWDGNDNLVEAAPGQRVHGVGGVFTTTLTTGATRENRIVEFDEGRRIAWKPSEPRLPAPGHLWRWEIEPLAQGRVRVTHTYDWTALNDPKRLIRARATTADKLRASLDRLAALVEAR